MKNILSYVDPDKIASRYLSIKVKITIAIAMLIVTYWIVTYEHTIIGTLAIFYSSILYSRVFMEIGYHRYFSHRSFETTKVKSRLLLIMGTLTGVGSCISWVGVHRTHHRFSDTKLDPHSPHNIGIIRVWLTWWGKDWVVDPSSVRDLLRDNWQVFFHKNYFKILYSWIAILASVSYVFNSILPLMIFALPCTVMIIFAGFSNAIAHKYGYRSYDTDDKSTNLHSLRWLLIATSLHNNHHAYPNKWNLNFSNRWYEFDFESWIIRVFLLKKGQ